MTNILFLPCRGGPKPPPAFRVPLPEEDKPGGLG